MSSKYLFLFLDCFGFEKKLFIYYLLIIIIDDSDFKKPENLNECIIIKQNKNLKLIVLTK